MRSLDLALHKVLVDLKLSPLWNNSLVLVTTDNGGGPWYSNAPLRGTKETGWSAGSRSHVFAMCTAVYEGGVRGASVLLSPLLAERGHRYPGLLHLTDWLPTILARAGVPAPAGLDGYDIWDAVR